MTFSSLLIYTSAALAFVAVIFLLMGFARGGWEISPPFIRTDHLDPTQLARLRAVQRADWKCGAGLLGVALIACAIDLFGTGPYFYEPSGNTAGGVVLVAVLVGLVVIIALLVRHATLSRALRKLN